VPLRSPLAGRSGPSGRFRGGGVRLRGGRGAVRRRAFLSPRPPFALLRLLPEAEPQAR